ncbi:MAG: hypothetical protein QOJ34_1932 [Pseudonocardiales bacterium]|nr:hypothetical protein [Pseudonocardiales bacterium]
MISSNSVHYAIPSQRSANATMALTGVFTLSAPATSDVFCTTSGDEELSAKLTLIQVGSII